MNQIKENSLYRLFFLLSKRRKRQLYFLTLLLILNGLIESFTLASIIPFLTLISSKNQIENISIIRKLSNLFGINDYSQLFLFLTISFCSFVLISVFLRIFNIAYIYRLSAKVNIDISYYIFKNNIYQSYINYTQRSSSEIISLALEKVQISFSALNSLLNVIASSVIGLFIVITLFIFKWQLVVSSLILILFYYFLVFKKVRKLLNIKGKKLSLLISKRLKVIQEAFEGFRDVIINGTEKIYIDLFNEADTEIKINNANSEFLVSFPKFLIEGLILISIILIGYYFFSIDIKLVSFIPIFGSFIYAFQRLLPLIQQIYAAWANYKYKCYVIGDLVKELENTKNNSKIYLSKRFIKFNKNIIFENVSFSYKSSYLILKDINLIINKGEYIGIYGETGSGKSTLLDLIMGLLKPDSGKILIDKLNTSEKRSNWNWSSNIAHVPQNIFLTEGTIEENIAFGESSENINHELVIHAAKAAYIYEFIKNTKMGFKTAVGERGIILSGGQRQRIAIARAIYKAKDILVLDEATSSLDESTEEKILNKIQKIYKNLTIIMVTHRLNSLKRCDRILKVIDQRIIEEK